jgi:sialic acid synthase SpsE
LLVREDLILKKPGGGIPEGQIEGLVGRRLGRAVGPDRLLSWDDLETDA